MGDPAGCGPLITCDAWSALRGAPNAAFFAIGPADAYHRVPTQVISTPDDAPNVFQTALPVLELDRPARALPAPGHPAPDWADAILQSIAIAADLATAQRASGIVTNPIAKAQLYQAGFQHAGHTEYLAALCTKQAEAPLRPVMMLVGGGLRVALATIHQPLVEAARSITSDLLIEIASIVDQALRRDFGIPSPRLAFSGLNPHAGEGGALGQEEIEIINPAAQALRTSGIDIADARPGDTVFAEALSGRFDAVIAMTHDQGLIPVKTLDFWGGVNTTLGLPIVRTSPDHGTAYDAAASGNPRPDSLIAAIRLARSMADKRARRHD